MAGLLKANVQLGDSNTSTQNFTLTVPSTPDGTMKLARGNAGSTTQDILTVDASGNVVFPQKVSQGTAQSMVRLNTANGYGSTNNKIRRFTNIVTNQGTDITYADSATLGASFTINTSGVYAISYSDCFNPAAWTALSLNTASPTTACTSLPTSEVLAMSVANNGTDSAASISWTGYLPTGSIVRAHTQGTASGQSIFMAQQFTIVRVA